MPLALPIKIECMKILPSLLMLFLLFGSCQSEQSPAQPPLPNTPAQVAQEWVEAFYSDNFTRAVSLSTDVTKVMIDSVIKEMESDAAMIGFKISNMACETINDSSRCTYIYQEERDRFEEYVDLVRQKGQWLVNEAWESDIDGEQELEMIRKELEKILEAENNTSINQ